MNSNLLILMALAMVLLALIVSIVTVIELIRKELGVNDLYKSLHDLAKDQSERDKRIEEHLKDLNI